MSKMTKQIGITAGVMIASLGMMSAAHAEGIEGELIVAVNSAEQVVAAEEEIIEAFMDEYPDVDVELQVNTTDYENLMKAKMAANDLPDVFMTHGWSLMRYSEYLLPLTNEPWAANMKETLKPSMCDEDGNFYALPVTADLTGILVQMDILDELGLEIPETIDDFLACCEAAKNAGYEAVFMAGKDTRSPAYVLDLMAPSFLINDDDGTIASSLADGSFDWAQWTPVVEFLGTLKEKGYLNEDCATADTVLMAEKLANKEALFIYQRNVQLMEAWQIDPDANLGFIPFPAQTAESSHYLVGGEGSSFGIWKDSENIDAAKAFLDFLARPENVEKMCLAAGETAGLDNIDADMGKLSTWSEKWHDVKVLSWFDRVYLPSGMWAILRDTGSAVIAGEATPEEATAIMQENYLKLLSQQ